MSDRLSSETIHATSVARDGRSVLILGPPGTGKSDLALRLFDRGFVLVSDDQTIVSRDDGRLLASAPSTISGKMEVRGIGIIEVETVQAVPVALAVELGQDITRMPEAAVRRFAGVAIPVIRIDAMAPSAPAKLDLALDRFGLKV